MTADLITALVLVAVLLRFSGSLPARVRAALAAVLLVVSLLPWPWGLAGWVQSYLSEFSISSGLLALVAIQHRLLGRTLLWRAQLEGACMVIAGLALFFYPMSLGATDLDPYALGYGSFVLSSGLLVAGLAAWVLRAYAACVVLIAAQVAYGLDLLGSDNLWDYLIDPALCLWAFGWLIRDRLRRSPAPATGPA